MKNKKLIFLGDLMSTFITTLPMLMTVLILVISYQKLSLTCNNFLVALVLVLIFPLLFIQCIFIIRLILPKVKEGTFSLGLNRGFIGWYLNLALGRSIRVFQVQDFIYSSYLLKYLYWKAMGANIEYGVHSSMYVNLVDLQLINIKAGVTLGDEVQVGCHMMIGDKIYLKKIFIESDSFIGINSKIGPGTKIGKSAFIGPWNILMRKKIKDNEKVEAFTFFGSESLK